MCGKGGRRGGTSQCCNLVYSCLEPYHNYINKTGMENFTEAFTEAGLEEMVVKQESEEEYACLWK